MSFSMSTFTAKTSTAPKLVTLPWFAWKSKLTRHDVRAVKDGSLYSPTIWERGATRGNDGIKNLSMIVRDFDDGRCCPDDLRLDGLAAIWHSTFSNSEDHPCWRLLIPLSRPVSRDEYQVIHPAIDALLGLSGEDYDRTCREPARMYYFPSCPPEHEGCAFAGTVDGEYADVDRLIEMAAEIVVEPEKPVIRFPVRLPEEAGSPGNLFNASASWESILEPHGYRKVKQLGDTSHWVKPGSSDSEAQLTTNYQGSDLLYSFSPKTWPFEEGRGYSKFAAHTFLNCGGDFGSAARELSGSGLPRVEIPAWAKAKVDEAADDEPQLFTSAVGLAEKEIHVSWLIRKFIERDTTGHIFGPTGHGKTFMVLDMALAVATGRPWQGHEVVNPGCVLYFAGEGHGGISRRLKAWLNHHGLNPDVLKNMHVSKKTVMFNGEGLEAAYRDAMLIQKKHGPIAMMIVDTLARHMEGDENSTKDMNRFIYLVDSLRQQFAGSVAVAIHHTGHSSEAKERGRGASSLKGAMDFEIMCNAGVLSWTKMKDGMEPDPVSFKLEPVEVGKDDDGSPITSCVIMFGEKAERYQTVKLTEVEECGVESLVISSARQIEMVGSLSGCLVGDWRDRFYDYRKELKPDESSVSRRMAFSRLKKTLADKGVILEDGNRVALTSHGHQMAVTSHRFSRFI